MIHCSQCGFDNLDQAIVCERCYLIFGFSGDQGVSSTLPAEPENSRVPRHRLPRPQVTLAKHSVALFIGNVNVPVVLQLPDAAYLGRQSDTVKVHPLLDLTPFGAMLKGVSRLHAALHRVGTGIAIEDLNSSNGTYYNATRLEPNVLFTLHSGYTIHVGTLAIEVVWEEARATSVSTMS